MRNTFKPLHLWLLLGVEIIPYYTVSLTFMMQKAYLDIIQGTRVLSESPDSALLSVGTHDGSFHCDEALAIAMLKFLPAYQHAVVVRTRK